MLNGKVCRQIGVSDFKNLRSPDQTDTVSQNLDHNLLSRRYCTCTVKIL